MRRAFTLLELMIGATMLVVVSIIAAPFFKSLVIDVPRAKRAIDTHSAVSGMIRQLRADVGAATALPAAAGGEKATDKLLLIASPAGLVRYEIRDGAVIRTRTRPDGTPVQRGTHEWPVPNAEIKWDVRQRGGRRCVVEVRTAVYVDADRGRQKRLVNAHLLFLGPVRPVGGKP